MYPQLSIIVPVYNCEKYVGRCIRSLLKQTCQDFEVILVNNGSTDRSLCVLEKYARKDSRLHVLSQENKGISGSRNTGLDAGRGKYLCFVDADDYVEPLFVETLLHAVQTNDCDMAVCDYAMTFRSREIRAVLGLTDEVNDVQEMENELFYLKYFARNPVVWNKIYRRNMICDAGIRFEIPHGEDLLFHLRLLPHVRRIATVSQTLYHYVQRKSSAAHSLQKVNAQNVTIIETYLKGAHQNDGTMAFYAFSSIYTGFLSSAYCAGRKIGYFAGQISAMEQADFFREFCKTIAFTGRLRGMYLEKAVSRRFYLIQKLQFGLCLLKWKLPAALFMWLCSRLIILKNRKLPKGQYV